MDFCPRLAQSRRKFGLRIYIFMVKKILSKIAKWAIEVKTAQVRDDDLVALQEFKKYDLKSQLVVISLNEFLRRLEI